jgi:hypothetical protein
LLPVRVHEATRRLVELVESLGPTEMNRLFAQATQDLWQHLQEVSSTDEFHRLCLQPLVFQGLLERDGDIIRTGSGWLQLKPYHRTLDSIGTMPSSLNELTAQSWFREEDL